MPGKDDPLQQSGPRRNPTTLWLDREHMIESRDAFFRAWLAAVNPSGGAMQWRAWDGSDDGAYLKVTSITKSVDEVRVEWDIAYAAAVAAFEFLMSGKMQP